MSQPAISSASHAAVAGLPDTAIVSHEELVRKKPVFRMVRDDGSNEAPVGSRNPVPPLEPPAHPPVQAVVSPPQLTMPVPVMTTQTTATVRTIAPLPPPPAQELAQDPPRPAVTQEVVFVNELVDLAVGCLEVTFLPDIGMLALVIPDNVILKLQVGQNVMIRHSGQEQLYWFTGLSIPITVVGARLIVFGNNVIPAQQ